MPLVLAALLGGCDVARVVIRPSSRSRNSSLQLPMPSLSHDLGQKGARGSACAVTKQTCSLSVLSLLGEAPRDVDGQ